MKSANRIKIMNAFYTTWFSLALSLLVAACGGGGGDGSQVGSSVTSSTSATQDTASPTVAITGPTSEASYVASASTISIVGTATDNVGLSRVSWTNSRGGAQSVPASGTSASLDFNIALAEGSNLVTVTATDTSGNTRQALLTVEYTPPAAPPPAPTTGSVILDWDPVVATNLSGYRLYYGTAPGSYQQVVNVGTSATYTLSGLNSGTRYYFAVTAFDTTGVESGYSNEVYKDIP